ncbi:unnamed protein product [Ambrosiozyma monospora]|uniref:Unnamed protein product n=1 Tax=Ambrosiozyma monospora TaxID=43982 RepID=A0ACB5T983_AMBMO|nr:unnamed protein product [Ambrosiozyma monospora]
MHVNIKGDDPYNEALELCIKLIEGNVEQNIFEETLRQGFRNKAFKLFTIDKVIQGLMKHCHTVVSDSKCAEIFMLMEKDRNSLRTSAKDQILYRMQVRNLMNVDEHMFKITYNKAKSQTNITFLALEDLTIKEGNKTDEEKWNYYLTSYSMSHPTEGIDSSKLQLPFLKSILEEEEEDESEIEGFSDSKLKVKIDENTYRLVFEPGSYDLFSRNSIYTQKPSRKTKKAMAAFKEALDGEFGLYKEATEEEGAHADAKFKSLVTEGAEAYAKFDEVAAEKAKAEAEAAEAAKVKAEAEKAEAAKSEADAEAGKGSDAPVTAAATTSSAVPSQLNVTLKTEATEGDSTIQQDETTDKVVQEEKKN